jgi:O-antigen/teichoic acid export membrane protein
VLNLFNKGIDFARAAIMLRILGPGDAGIYSYAIVIFLWFDILTNFGLNTLLTREAARHKDEAGRYLLNSSILRIGLANAAIPLLGIFLLVRQAAVSPPLEPRAIVAILLLYAGLLPSSISTGLTALFYAFEKAEYPAAIQTVSTLLNAALSLTVLILGWGVIGLAGVSIVVNVITLSILAWLSRAFIGPVRALWGQRDRGLIRHMVGESWPLMINHLLATVFFKLDVILLEAFRGAMVVGWYSSAYKWLDAINVIPGMLSTALLPVMAVQAHEDKAGLARNYRFVVKLLVLIALPLAVGSMFVAEVLVGVLGGASFLPHGAIALQIMIWSIPFGWINSITNYLIVALDSQRALTWTFVAGVGFNVIANLIFVPTYGYPAAAVTSILSEIVLLGAFYVLVRRDLEPMPWLRMLWRPAAAAALMLSAILIVRTVNEIAALAVGVGVYGGALWVLKPLNADERAQLRDLLPG